MFKPFGPRPALNNHLDEVEGPQRKFDPSKAEQDDAVFQEETRFRVR